MQRPFRSLGSIGVFAPCLAAVAVAVACASDLPADDVDELGSGGTSTPGLGGTTGAGHAGTSSAQAGATASGGKAGSGMTGTGGAIATGGAGSTGGVSGAGGSAGTIGSTGGIGSGGVIGSAGGIGSGGMIGSGGVLGSGGSAGAIGSTGGIGSGGMIGSGGVPGSGGADGGASPGGRSTGGGAGLGSGGVAGRASGGGAGAGSSGTGSGGTGGATSDACATTTLPSGGTNHPSSNASGMASGLAWTIWSNGSGGSITTFDTPAFKATWANSGDFLARLGLQWNATKLYTEFGTITAQFSSKKTGSGGGYSYIGIYGWSVSPCVEFYIVDDSFNTMPVNPGNTTNKGTATIDGEAYNLYTRNTTGTGGSKCSGVSSWVQFYSVRKKARTCGQISITQHFDAWAAAGMALGKMDQAQILVEVGGGSGNVELAVASVSSTM